MTQAGPGEIGAAGAETLQPQRRDAMVKGRLIRLRVPVARDVHRQPSCPVSMRYAPLGSIMATSLTMQPSPRVQRHGKAANVTRVPVTLSMSPPTFSNPQMPADRI